MEQVFLTILNMSITASWLALAVMILRCFLKKVPKSLVVVMWALVGVRLICPFFVESSLSLIPSTQVIPNDVIVSEELSGKEEWQPDDTVGANKNPNSSANQTAQPNTGSTADIPQMGGTTGNPNVGNNIGTGQDVSNNTGTGQNVGNHAGTEPDHSAKTEQNVGVQAGQTHTEKRAGWMKQMVPVMTWIWVVGVIAMFAYSMITYIRLSRRVHISICAEKNIYLCDEVDNPFILGILRPRIYVPSGMEMEQMKYVIEHEMAHLQRKDHWWKPIGFALLAVHWFNPVMWAAYILLCRDIELACDEKVIKNMGTVDKKGYSQALLACSMQKRMILACPLAFGEVGIKERVRTVKNYKKPAFWIVVIGVVVCIALGVGFLTNPNKISQVMYKDVVYVETEMPEWAHTFVYVGEIQSSTKEEVPTENLQANVDWEGHGIYTAINTDHYIFVLEDGEYIAHKNMSVDSAEEQKEMSDEEISNAIEAYLIDYLENYSETEDEALNQLVSNMFPYNGGVRTNYETGLVDVTIICSTKEKEKLFKEKIMDSKYVAFENFTAAQLGYPMEPDPEIDWGLTLSVENLTPRGMTLVFTQSGAEQVKELTRGGADYYLCVKENGTWVPVEYKTLLASDSMARGITKNGTSSMEANWERFYGELPVGTYRIGMEISAKIEFKYEDAYFFADFEITDDMITYGNVPDFDSLNEYTLSSMQNRLAGHSQTQMRHAWGEPDEELVGLWGDVWKRADGNAIVVYYNADGKVLQVKYQYENPKGNDIYSAVEVYADMFEDGTSIYTNCLNAEQIKGGLPRGTYRIPIYKMENVADLEAFRTNYVDGTNLYDFSEALNFYTITEGMDEKYFEQFALFIVYVKNYNYSWKHSVTSISNNGWLLEINVKQSNHPTQFAEAREGRLLLVPIEKSQLDGVKVFNAYMEDWRTYDTTVITEITDSYMILDNIIRVKNWFYPEYELKEGDKVTAIYDGGVLETYPGRYSNLYEIFFIDENGERITVITEK